MARPDNVAVGIATMTATAFAMSLGDAVVKWMSADLGLWQLFVLRSLIAVPLLVGLLALTGGLRRPVRARARWVVARSALLIGMWVSFYAALTRLEFATVATAYYTGPLFIVLLSSWLIRERVGPRRWLAVATGFTGMLFILTPAGDDPSWVVLLAVLSGFFYALGMIVTRARLAAENPLAIALALNVAFLVAGTIGSAAQMAWAPDQATIALQPFLFGPWRPLGIAEWVAVGFLAILIVGITSGVAKAYQSAPSSIIATIDYSYLVFAAAWGFLFFDEAPELSAILGMILIGGAGMVVARNPNPKGS